MLKDEAKNIVVEKLKELQAKIAANIETTKQTASGSTAKSMHVEQSENGAALFGRRAFGTLETGRRGGRVPQNFRAIIRQWIRDKGISVTPVPYVRQPSDSWQPKYTPQERGEMSLAGAIAHKIAKDGTKLYRDGGQNNVYSQEIPLTIASIKGEIIPLLTAEVRQVIKINSN